MTHILSEVDAMTLCNLQRNSTTPNSSDLMTSFSCRPPHRKSVNYNEKNKSTGQEKKITSEAPDIEG